MIHGIGVDLIEIDRIKVLYSKQPKLVERILTKNEQHKFNNFTHEQRKIEFL
ncbi:holo-[acyl-carrier-protein] synthase, partial [Staphylococcus aureus M1402]